MFEPNLLHETVQLGRAVDDVGIMRELRYLELMNQDSEKIEKIGNFLDLIANRMQGLDHNGSEAPLINFWDTAEEADLLDEVRTLLTNDGSHIIPPAAYVFDSDHLKEISTALHSRVTNVHQPNLGRLQMFYTNKRLEASAIYECMSSIVKRCNHSHERIIANFASHR